GISSWTPSAEEAFCVSSVTISRGRMAMMCAGIAVGQTVVLVSGRAEMAGGGDVRWEKINELIKRATADTSRAAISAILGQPGEAIRRTADACLNPSPRLSFPGTCGLPRFSL